MHSVAARACLLAGTLRAGSAGCGCRRAPAEAACGFVRTLGGRAAPIRRLDLAQTSATAARRTRSTTFPYYRYGGGESIDMDYGPSSSHGGGVGQLRADGSVDFLADSTAAAVYDALVTREESAMNLRPEDRLPGDDSHTVRVPRAAAGVGVQGAMP